ncbi:MAG: hypothetical protein FWD13_02275 [Treponema sp.]|nr:hypothetical protein [Treponema sp.]
MLNELYSNFLTGKISRTDFEGLIYTRLINNQDKTCLNHWKSDEYEDFISWFYPRLQKTIDSYQEIGSSFESFLNKYFFVSSKEYRVRAVTNAVTEYSAWSVRIPEMYTREEPPEYIHKNTEDVITRLIIDKKGRKNTRRILALILKCYYYVSDDLAEKIALKIGVNSNELIEMLRRIRKIRQKKDDAIYLLKERIYCQYYRCIIYEKKKSLARENTAVYNKYTYRLEKARERLEKMRKRLAGIRMEATNKQVAEIIGISKGTVDASLHRLKIKWETMSKKADLN